ncbi:translocation/assembly module TamB, partial [bacterium]|nr:translocation/assembly module TamB [bacterium]
ATRVFALDTAREFAATMLCSSYVVEAGPAFLPQIRGRKQFRLTGSALVAGRADSLRSLKGAAVIEDARASWGFVSFSLADTFAVATVDGAVEIDDLSLEVVRQRALGPEAGGTIDVTGRIDRDGRLALAARTADLDVAHVLRAFLPDVSSPVTGILTADVAVGGDVTSPELDFSWDLHEPTLGGVRFDALRGSGLADPYVLELSSAELKLGTSVLEVRGVVPLQRAQGPAMYPGMRAGVSEMDITVRADRFRIDRSEGLPEGVDRLVGVIDADVRLRGAPEAPDVEGVVTVEGGRVELARLKHAIRDIELRAMGAAGTATLERASASLGGGSIAVTGSMQTSSASSGGFGFEAALDGVEVVVEDMMDARLDGSISWVGTAESSFLRSRITVDEAEVTHDVGLSDLLVRRPQPVTVARAGGRGARVALDVAADIVEPIHVRSNLADMDLSGGVRVGGTLASPVVSGGVSADGGSLWYLGQEFLLNQFSVIYTDPRRRVPFVDASGTAIVESSSGEEYIVTIVYRGFPGETVPELTSAPPLSEPDIAALLTFGDTMGVLTSGGSDSGSAGDSFGTLARSAFVGGLFGVAESTVRRWLNLDTLDVSGEALDSGDLAETQVTFGKRFGRKLSIDYTTDLSGFSGQTVGLSWRLTNQMSIATKANQEGNHAIGLTFRFRFE